jgi:NADH/NAD ratio-sensing transcriptional regulator Rex
MQGRNANPDAIIGTIQLRETTLTENSRSSKATGVEHKASNFVSLKKSKAKNSQRRNSRTIKQRQPMRAKRIRKDMIYIGTWNVMTMLKTGKMYEIVDEMLKTQLQIIALQELRWKGVGKINKSKYTLYYSCNPPKNRPIRNRFYDTK